MTTTIPAQASQSNRDALPAATTLEALADLAAKNFAITGIAEYVENGVRVRVTFYPTGNPHIGLSRVVDGLREHLPLEGYHTVGGLQVRFDAASAVEHAVDLAGVSDKWAVTR